MKVRFFFLNVNVLKLPVSDRQPVSRWNRFVKLGREMHHNHTFTPYLKNWFCLKIFKHGDGAKSYDAIRNLLFWNECVSDMFSKKKLIKTIPFNTYGYVKPTIPQQDSKFCVDVGIPRCFFRWVFNTKYDILRNTKHLLTYGGLCKCIFLRFT